MFGDTFVGDGTDQDRRNSLFLRNTIGIQEGLDPSKANIAFHWREVGGRPSSFFTEREDGWRWPMHGLRVRDTLILFFMLVRPKRAGGEGGTVDWEAAGALGFFDVFGWEALAISNPDDSPDAWDVAPIAAPDPSGRIVGTSLLENGEHVYAYSWLDRRAYLLRWPLEAFVAVDLRRAEWWSEAGWSYELDSTVVLPYAQTEFTVHEDAGFVHTQVDDLFNGRLTLRRSSNLHGPWSEPMTVLEPAWRDDLMVYAGKAHPELEGADLVLTYATNLNDVYEVLDSDVVYYPRFVRVSL